MTITPAPVSSSPRTISSRGLMLRLSLVAIGLAAEWVPISALVHTGRGGASAARAIATFVALLCTFGYLRLRPEWRRLDDAAAHGAWISTRILGVHVIALCVFLGLSKEARGLDPGAGIQTVFWFLAGLTSIASLPLALVPIDVVRSALRRLGWVWAYAAAGAWLAWSLLPRFWSLWTDGWEPASALTMRCVVALLQLVIHPLFVDLSKKQVGSDRFVVEIGGACGGLEGIGLMLVFSAAWLWLLRREIRFPHALLLVPAGLAFIYGLNILRITALVLIGHFGAPGVAEAGFHSQAGWLAFNTAAIAFALAASRVSWLRRSRISVQLRDDNPTVAYLMPFLLILAASMLSRAASDGFEWLYGLRVLAAAGALWYYRRSYATLEWRPTLAAPVAGLLVLALWLGLDHWLSASPRSTALGLHLAAMPVTQRFAWIGLRIAGAVATVPLAEELAFRGFLLRRLVSADFTTVSMRNMSWTALLLSSLAFGLMHGSQWLAGTLAGLLYAGALLYRGRIGDAVLAHAITNAALALVVLLGGRWDLW